MSVAHSDNRVTPEDSTVWTPYIKGLIEDQEVSVFLDTGAGLSLISEALHQRIPALKHRPLLKCFQVAHTLTGHQLDILGSLTVTLHLGSHIFSMDMYVVRDSRQDALLGWDFFKTHGASIDTASGAFMFKNEKISLFSSSQALIKHSIHTSSTSPVRQRAYRTSPVLREEIHKQVQKLLDADLIEPSHSPWASPVILVRKKDGSYRFCIDYRRLNSITIKDAHPLPRVDDSLDALSGVTLFSTLDLSSGYWQIQMDDASREKTAFTMGDSLYHFKVMPMGLTNAPPDISAIDGACSSWPPLVQDFGIS